MSFDKDTRNALARMVTSCRRLLTTDVTDQLRGTFGLHPDGTVLPLKDLGHLTEDMEADSLDLVGLIMSFETLAEDEYGLAMEIPDEEAQKIGTVEEAVAYLEKVLGEAGVEF